VVVVRSEAFLQGWRATATPVGGGPVRTLTVGPRGLVQSVRVPAGHYLVTFTFRAKNLTVGMGASVAALVAFAALGVVALLRRRRRRRSAGEPVESAPIVMGDRVPT
jgi:hypothetical protein